MVYFFSCITFVNSNLLKEFTMVNIDDFTNKLEKLLDYYNLTASSFADKIGVQRSSMSHLLSGRNKPSLDFVLKISEEFPEVDLYWLLLDKGEFPKESFGETQKSEIKAKPEVSNLTSDLFNQSGKEDEYLNKDVASYSQNSKAKEYDNNVMHNFTTDIEKIVVFYTDGTFKQYKPKK